MEAILNYPPLKTVSCLRRSTGMAQHYRRFVMGFAHVAELVFALLKKDVNLLRGEDGAEHCKDGVITTYISSHPNLPMLTQTDHDVGQVLPLHQLVVGAPLHGADARPSVQQPHHTAVPKW